MKTVENHSKDVIMIPLKSLPGPPFADSINAADRVAY